MGNHEKACDRLRVRHDMDRRQASTGYGGLVVTGSLEGARQPRDAYRGVGGSSVFGTVDSMPEEALSHDIVDPHDRLMYLTLTVAIDYQRDAVALWKHARARYDDAATRWLFRAEDVAAVSVEEVLAALRRGDPRGALRFPTNDAKWWHRNASVLAEHYDGSPLVLFERTGWDVHRIRKEISREGRFLGLRGPKIFPLWIRMLGDVMGYRFVNYAALPIPVDIHVARASFTCGLIRGTYDGPFDEGIISFLRRAWTEACAADGEAHMTFDEPLWQLSRIGCTHRHEGGGPDCSRRVECPIGDICPRGTIALSVERVRIEV